MNPAPAGPAKGTQLSDRELIKALRDRIRPAEGDPVDVVDVRSDASDVVKFAGIVGEIGGDAARTQQTKSSVNAKLGDVAKLRGEVERDAYGLLTPEESEALTDRLRAFEAQSGTRLLEPETAEPASENGEAPQEVPEVPAEERLAAVDERLATLEERLIEENHAAALHEAKIVERADKLQQAVGAEDEQSVQRLALKTAQKIAAEGGRAITAQTTRLDVKNLGALANG